MQKFYRKKWKSNCTVCNSKKLRFVKEKEVSGLLSSLGITIALSKIPLIGSFFF